MLRGESDREKIRDIQALAREIIRLNGGRDIRFVPERTFIYCDTDSLKYIRDVHTEGVTDGKENRTSNTGRY